MTCAVSTRPAGTPVQAGSPGVVLDAERLAEPAGLRDELYELALVDSALARREAAPRLGAWIVDSLAGEADSGPCRSQLEVAIRAASASSTREIWLWVMGERRWEPTAAAMLGRAARRMAA